MTKKAAGKAGKKATAKKAAPFRVPLKGPELQNWLAVGGGVIRPTQSGFDYIPINPSAPVEVDSRKPGENWALAKTNVMFPGGVIEFTTEIHAADDRIQIALPQPSGAVPELGAQQGPVFAGLNVGGAAFGIGRSGGQGFQYLASSGNIYVAFDFGKEFKVRLEMQGSNIVLFANGVQMCSASIQTHPSQVAFFVSGRNKLSVRDVRILPALPSVFVVMQFTPEYDALYKEVIYPLCKEFGYRVVRADDIATNGLIVEDISKSIREASVVLADITPNNPNVFYEVGYSHALGKETILLSDKARDKLPFDVSGFRTLFYENSIAGKARVEELLRKHLTQIAPPSI